MKSTADCPEYQRQCMAYSTDGSKEAGMGGSGYTAQAFGNIPAADSTVRLLSHPAKAALSGDVK